MHLRNIYIIKPEYKELSSYLNLCDIACTHPTIIENCNSSLLTCFSSASLLPITLICC